MVLGKYITWTLSTRNEGYFTLELEGLKGPRKFEWMKNLHDVLYGMQWIMFHGLMDLLQAHLIEVGLAQTQENITLQNLTTVFQV